VTQYVRKHPSVRGRRWRCRASVFDSCPPREASEQHRHDASEEYAIEQLYGGMDEPEIKIIDVFMCKIRRKLAVASGGKDYIETVWGRGYLLRDPQALKVNMSA
jgi:hypothetical protein